MSSLTRVHENEAPLRMAGTTDRDRDPAALVLSPRRFAGNERMSACGTSVPTLIEQIQLVRRFLREVLKGSVLKQA